MVHCEKNWQRMIIQPLGFMNCGRGTQQKWYNIGPEIIKNVIDTMPLRFEAIRKNEGEWTKY